VSYPTHDIQKSKEVMHVIQKTKVEKTYFSLGFVIILEGLHSLVAFEMEIEPTHIDEELNASTMDFPHMTKDGIL
jgi:hypothetical protein